MKKMLVVLMVLLLTGGLAWAQAPGYKVRFAHNGEPDLAEFRIFYSETSGSGYAISYTIPLADYVVPPAWILVDVALLPGTYYFVVIAVDESGNPSGDSNEATLVVSDTPPGACTALEVDLQ